MLNDKKVCVSNVCVMKTVLVLKCLTADGAAANGALPEVSVSFLTSHQYTQLSHCTPVP